MNSLGLANLERYRAFGGYSAWLKRPVVQVES